MGIFDAQAVLDIPSAKAAPYGNNVSSLEWKGSISNVDCIEVAHWTPECMLDPGTAIYVPVSA